MKDLKKVLLLVIIYCFLCNTTLFVQNLEDTETIVYQPVSKNAITGEIKREPILQSCETESDSIQSISSDHEYMQTMETQAYIPVTRRTTIFEDMQSKTASDLGEYVIEPLKILGKDNRSSITQTTTFPNSAILFVIFLVKQLTIFQLYVILSKVFQNHCRRQQVWNFVSN